MMEKSSAIRIIKNTFEKPFDKEQYRRFIKELFNHLDESNNFFWAGNRIPNAGAFQPFINSIERVGKYQDAAGKKIDCLIVNLKKETSLEYARTSQRNFVARYLQGHMGGDDKDAALVAFISPPDSKDWRFSLVKVDYSFDLGKLKTELTPARRYSFLVGEHESSHTAQLQLLSILQEDRRDPLLTEFEDAFSVEVVTKEFFTKYRELYYEVEEALQDVLKKDTRVRDNFQANKVDTVNFSKKLLGQIVFLYFLQKKGWFGVPRSGEWGQGSKNFLHELFERKHGDYRNFFNDILEPLFYEALRNDRSHDDHYYSRFDCKIPFLNGGLFDPVNNYDWVGTEILLPNELFSNTDKSKEGDTGTGILDVFDRYNFTVKEDEPLDKEVAVDPEMLGKVFENLLEVKDRKSKGTYYTPREIVNYMCQESLINYLDTTVNSGTVPLSSEKPINLKLLGAPATQQIALKTEGYTGKVPRDDIDTFVRMGELAVEHDARVENTGKETKDYVYQLPASIRLNAGLIDDALARIRVCDPAIGSGAFPVGMMTEIVRARDTLTTYITDKAGRTKYNFKRHAIQNCLYGVDIDSSAVEIAKLRLWLSLVVDEGDIKQIQPLPNLDFKVVCGNSLLGVERNMFNNDLFQKLEELKPLYFDETNTKRKQDFKRQIDQLIMKLTNNKETFDFEVYFSEVFHEKGGFDLIIANPPYISHDKLESKDYFRKSFSCFEPFADIYCYFLEIAANLQNTNGLLCFITSNSYIKAKYGAPLRGLLKRRIDFLELINIEDYQVFEAAIVNTAVIIARKKGSHSDKCIVVNATHDGSEFLKFIKQNTQYYNQSDFAAEPWSLTSHNKLEIIRKIEKAGKTLEEYHVKIRLGIATGANEAFLIDERTRGILISKDPKNKQIIKPVLRGRDVFRYKYQWSNQYILLTKNDIDVKREYPTIYSYLASFGEDFKNRGAQGDHWTNLRHCSFYEDFKKEKIVWIELTDHGRFALCDQEVYLLNTAYFLLPPSQLSSKYLLGILNSKLIEFYINMIAQTSGMGVTRWINEYVKRFPIPEVAKPRQNLITEIVDKVLSITNNVDYSNNALQKTKVIELERQIDCLVYELYGLTSDEIAAVEDSIKSL